MQEAERLQPNNAESESMIGTNSLYFVTVKIVSFSFRCFILSA